MIRHARLVSILHLPPGWGPRSSGTTRGPGKELNWTVLVRDGIAILGLGGLYTLLAIGIALVFGIMRLVNFAYGELIMVAGYLLALAFTFHWGLAAAIVLALGAAVVVALLQDRTAFRPIRGASAETLMVTSFAVSFMLQALAQMISGAKPKGVDNPIGTLSAPSIAGVSIDLLSLLTFVGCAACIAALALFLHGTTIGVQMRAAAEDFTMVRALGIPANRVIAVAFALSGAFAGVAAVFLTARTGSIDPTSGVAPLLIAFVVTVLGGLGSLVGAAMGAFVLAGLTVIVQAVLPPAISPFRDALAFAVLLLILLIRPQGLIGRKQRQA